MAFFANETMGEAHIPGNPKDCKKEERGHNSSGPKQGITLVPLVFFLAGYVASLRVFAAR